jgi:hypothetical protein
VAANRQNIADERKMAKEGGVVNLEAIYIYQERIRDAHADAANLKAAAKEAGFKSEKASSPKVAKVAACFEHGSDSTLRNEKTFSPEDAAAGTCFWLYLFTLETGHDGRWRQWQQDTFGLWSPHGPVIPPSGEELLPAPTEAQ